MKRIDSLYQCLLKLCTKQYQETGKVGGVAATEIGQILNLQRSNVSSDLNVLFKAGRINKIAGKPVLYCIKEMDITEYASRKEEQDVFSSIIGADCSLKYAIEQAKAAIIYPTKGLHTLICGETGTGKSLFAEKMYAYAQEIRRIKEDAPFIVFNCADYANNPGLLMAQLFGVKKGAYTGADKDRAGIVEKADTGILFLDEVHRLPPEGQEMLFYLIDKGSYRKLGEPHLEYKAEILIICATTENIESALLTTFTRRIPMVIKIPALKERSMKERYELIKYCFKKEAFCIKEDLIVAAQCMKALLLYECANNIGQLESDVKLCCAKGFLENRAKKRDNICIYSEYLPQHVLKGLFKVKEYKAEIDKLITKEAVKFFVDASNEEKYEKSQMFNLYEALEEKQRSLEAKGINAKDIGLIMSLELDRHFKKYILTMDKQDLEDLYKVVDKKLVTIVGDFLQYAENKLIKKFDSKILYGLSMHMARSVERICNGNAIINHQLVDIKKSYPEEFTVACSLGNTVERELGIHLSADEVGYITMFLCLDKEVVEDASKVGILVAMHGESTATSIADVANRLLGENYAVGYNMPLDQKVEIALENLIQLAQTMDQGKGILLLVDMGSLALLGDIIYERTQIPVKTVEMISTSTVIEATRKALLHASLAEIHGSCNKQNSIVGRFYRDNFSLGGGITNNVIVTACITGHGTAIKLKSIIEEQLENRHRDIGILPIEIASKVKFNNSIQNIKYQKNIMAIIGAMEPEDKTILYIPISEIFKTNGLSQINQQLDMIKIINNMKDVITSELTVDAIKFCEQFKGFYFRVMEKNVQWNENILVGLLLHIAHVIQRVSQGQELIHMEDQEAVMAEYGKKVYFVKEQLKSMEKAFQIEFSIAECIPIAKIIYLL